VIVGIIEIPVLGKITRVCSVKNLALGPPVFRTPHIEATDFVEHLSDGLAVDGEGDDAAALKVHFEAMAREEAHFRWEQ
jgi:hypothetical protein